MLFIGSSSQKQQFVGEVLTADEEEDQAEISHFSKATFTKHPETRIKKAVSGHMRQISSDYRGDNSTNIEFSGSETVSGGHND